MHSSNPSLIVDIETRKISINTHAHGRVEQAKPHRGDVG